jgi:hypothetical protein
MSTGKLGIDKLITSTQSLGEFDIDSDGKIAFSTVNAGPTFTIEVKGRKAGQTSFTFIDTVVGSADKTVVVTMWDFLQINITVYDSTSNFVKLIASGSNTDSEAINSINTPNGSLVATSDLNFTSQDNSVTITANINTNTIDFAAVGGGGGTTKYVKTVLLGDWVGPSSGEYTLTIAHSFHGIPNPQVVSYETSGADFEQILVPIKIDAAHNITLTVPQTPDTRFIGKIVIE